MMQVILEQYEGGQNPVKLIGSVDFPKLISSVLYFIKLSSEGVDDEIFEVCTKIVPYLKKGDKTMPERKKRWKNVKEDKNEVLNTVTSIKEKLISENVTTGNIKNKSKPILEPVKENKKPVAFAENEELESETNIQDEEIMEIDEKETTQSSKASETKTEQNQSQMMDIEGEN